MSPLGYKRKFGRLVINARFKAESGRKWWMRSMSVDNVADISQITSRTVAIVDNLDYRRKKLRSAAIR